MKLLFGLAVAILVLATTLEVVNADECPTTLSQNGQICYDAFDYPFNRYTAEGECATFDSRVPDLQDISTIIGELNVDEGFWVQTDSGTCQVFNGQLIDYPCALEAQLVCIKYSEAPAVLTNWLDNPENCICKLHDDPLIKTCDDATIKIYGENKGFRFIQSSEYASEQCFIQVDFHLGDDQALTKIYIKMKDTGIWMYGDSIRETNENAPPHFYTATDPVFEQQLQTAADSGNVVRGDITISYDGDIATFTSTHCEVQFEFRASPNPLLRATIGERYDNDLMWLCGNFNGNMTDDYRIANGIVIFDAPDRYPQISNYASQQNQAGGGNGV